MGTNTEANHQFKEILEQSADQPLPQSLFDEPQNGMKVTFLGTGTSMGVPVAGSFGREVPTGDIRDERYRSSIWIQTPESSIIIDIGPEFRLQTLRSGIRRVDMVLITHEHYDHIGGLDDLRPFNYMQKQIIPVLTTPGCAESIFRRYEYIFEPNKTPGSVDISMQTGNQPVQFKDCTITPLPVMHGNLPIYGFRVNNLAYITDCSFIPDETFDLIRGCDVLVLDALRWEPPHPTHFTVDDAIKAAKRSGIRETYLIHMSSYVHHEKTNARLPDGIRLAYDQQVLYL